MVEVALTPFIMHGARDAIAGGLAHVEEHVEGIERAVVDNPGLAFDLARGLVESACKAVLSERAIVYSDNDDLPKLFKEVTNSLELLPVSASDAAGARTSLKKTLNGLSTAIQGICELRNQFGYASHGSATQRPPMEAAQALLAAEAADTIVGFIFRVHRQDRTPPHSTRQLYEDNKAFNDSVDDSHGMVRIYEVEFLPSDILFQMEPETYRVYLAEFEVADGGAESGAVPGAES